MKIVKFIVCLLFGLMFINAGLNKFFQYMPAPQLSPEQQKVFDAFVEIGWLLPLTGVAEIIAGLLVIFPKTRTLGALIIFPVMVGILVHAITKDSSVLIMAGVLFLINVWMLWDNREKLKGIFS